MGLVHTVITLKNAGDIFNAGRGIIKEPEIRQTTVAGMVDTRAAVLIINDPICRSLGLSIENSYEAQFANGKKQVYSCTEAVQILWKNRKIIMRAVLIPGADHAILGAIPVDDLYMVATPYRQKLKLLQ